MRRFITIIAATTMFTAAPAMAQSNAELRAQLEQTRAQIAEAEAMGMDAGIVAQLKDAMNEVERSLAEDEAAAASDGNVAADPAPTVAASYPTRPSLLDGEPACASLNEANYRAYDYSQGPDVQLDTMCGQAIEYYVMYKRAIAQGYSEADANRTYAAHEAAAQNALAFYANNRAN